MDMAERDLFSLLDLAPDAKKKLLAQIETDIAELRQELLALRVRYVGESNELYWFQDAVTDGGLTVKKNGFSPLILRAQLILFRRKYGIK